MSMITLFQGNGNKQPELTTEQEIQQIEAELEQIASQEAAQTQRVSKEQSVLDVYAQTRETKLAELDQLRKKQAREFADSMQASDIRDLRVVAQRINDLSEQLGEAMTEFDEMLRSRHSLTGLRNSPNNKGIYAVSPKGLKTIGLSSWWQILPVVMHEHGTTRFYFCDRLKDPNENGASPDRLKNQRSKEKL